MPSRSEKATGETEVIEKTKGRAEHFDTHGKAVREGERAWEKLKGFPNLNQSKGG